MLPYDWEDDDANDIPIRSDRMQAQDQDIADALTQSLSKDGQTTPTANLTMGGYKLTNLGAATNAADAPQLAQNQSNTGVYVAATGTNSYSIAPSPSVSALSAGMAFLVKFANANTGACTLAVNAISAVDLTKDGTVALGANDITAGMMAWVAYDGTRFQLVPALKNLGPWGLTDGGMITADSASAAVNTFYLVDCSASARTVILSSATTAQRFGFGKFGTNTLTLNLNGQKFQGDTINPTSDAAEGITVLIRTSDARGFIEG